MHDRSPAVTCWRPPSSRRLANTFGVLPLASGTGGACGKWRLQGDEYVRVPPTPHSSDAAPPMGNVVVLLTSNKPEHALRTTYRKRPLTYPHNRTVRGCRGLALNKHRLPSGTLYKNCRASPPQLHPDQLVLPRSQTGAFVRLVVLVCTGTTRPRPHSAAYKLLSLFLQHGRTICPPRR